MWPFKKKQKPVGKPAKELPEPGVYVYAEISGRVSSVMCDHILVDEVRHDVKCPLVRVGQKVVPGQIVGKKP